MRFIGDSGREINSVTKRKKRPQAFELKRSSIGLADSFEKSAGGRIVIIYFSIAEISDPKFAVHQGQPPRGIQFPVRHQTFNKIAAGIEHIDESVARPMHIVVLFLILQGAGHIDWAAYVLDSERCISGRKIRISKTVRINRTKTLIISLYA